MKKCPTNRRQKHGLPSMSNFDPNDRHPLAGAFAKGFASGFTSPLTIFSDGPTQGGFTSEERASVASSFRSVGNALTHNTLKGVTDRERQTRSK
jgi:hypothetical protein